MRLEVLNPVAQKVVKKGGRSAPRLPTLEGKRVGLYWNLKPGGDAALRRTAELLAARYAGVETGIYMGSVGSSNRFATREDVQRISREVSAVIGATAD